MTDASRSTRSARTVVSSRLPIGVATTNSVPDMWVGNGVFIVPLADLWRWPATPKPLAKAGPRPSGSEKMIASEPLPHFADDLLGYLHETHPTHATLDGVHTHDDLLEDLSAHAIEGEAHALAGYLRRLDEISSAALTPIERLEHRMLTAHLRARMLDLEDVR